MNKQTNIDRITRLI